MNMKKILESMDAAAVGNKPFKGDPNFNDMKKILESFHGANTKTKKEITESATMSINMTADNASQVGELMALMRNAGMDPKPVSADMPMPAPNASKFSQAQMDDPNIPGRDDVVGDQDLQAGALGSAVGGGLGAMVGGPLGAAVGGGIGHALTDEPNDDPNIPGRDDVEGDQDLQAGALGTAIGGGLGAMVAGPIGAAGGAALGHAISDDEVDDPNIPGRDDVEGDQDLQAGVGGALAGGLAGGAAGHVLGKGAGAALGSVLGPAGTAIGGEVGGQIGQAIGTAVPGAVGAQVGSAIGDKLTGEETEELNNIKRLSGLKTEEPVANEGGMSDVMISVDELISDYTNGGEKDSGLKMPKDEVIQAIKDSGADPMEISFAIDSIKSDFDDQGNYKYAGYDEADDLNVIRKNAGLEIEEWDNEPEEEYAPYSDMVRGGTDLNKSKKSYPKVAGGDNPMALKDKIKEELTAYYEKYKTK